MWFEYTAEFDVLSDRCGQDVSPSIWSSSGSKGKNPTSSLITLFNTQNEFITKIVYSSSTKCAETKYGLKIQFLALVVMIHEVWLNT